MGFWVAGGLALLMAAPFVLFAILPAEADSGSSAGQLWLVGLLIGMPLIFGAGAAVVFGPLMLRAASPSRSPRGKWGTVALLLFVLVVWRFFRPAIELPVEPVDVLLPASWLLCFTSLWVFRRR